MEPFHKNYSLPSYIYVYLYTHKHRTLASSSVFHCLFDFLIAVVSTRGNGVSVMLYVNKF